MAGEPAKKATKRTTKKAAPQEVTGPSSEPREPLMTMGKVVAPVARTAGQSGAAWTIMEAVEAYNIYNFSDRQWAITLTIGTVVLSWLQNTLEARSGRRLIGTAN